jgi:uncharacterized protein
MDETLLTMILHICASGAMMGIVLFIARRRHFFVRTSNDITMSWVEGVMPFFVFFGAFLLLSPLLITILRIFPDHDQNPVIRHAINFLAMALSISALAWYLCTRQRVIIKALFRGGVVENASMGFVSWLISFPCVVFMVRTSQLITQLFAGEYTGEQDAVIFFKESLVSPWLTATAVLFITLLIPAIEELLFRGYLQNLFKKVMSPYKAIVVTSALFAAAHCSLKQGYKNIEISLSLFVLSLFLGYIYERQRSLWSPIAHHAIFNGISMLFISIS